MVDSYFCSHRCHLRSYRDCRTPRPNWCISNICKQKTVKRESLQTVQTSIGWKKLCYPNKFNIIQKFQNAKFVRFKTLVLIRGRGLRLRDWILAPDWPLMSNPGSYTTRDISNRFCCKLAQVVHGTKAWHDQLRVHEVKGQGIMPWWCVSLKSRHQLGPRGEEVRNLT